MTKRLWLIVLVLPLVGGLVGYMAGPFIARAHRDVKLAARVAEEESGALASRTLESEAFRATGQPISELFRRARLLRDRLAIGSAMLGAWAGLVLVLKFFSLRRIPPSREYEIEHGTCLCCARCFLSCPREHLRLKQQRGPKEQSAPRS